MTDIVERLLNWLNQSQQEQHETAIEAADEIKRLREENERMRDALTQIEGCFSSVEAAAAITRERITDALDGCVWIDLSGDEG